MTIDEPAIRSNKGRPMSKGEIGCYASHFSIWQDMVTRGVRQAIVLEDDTVVDWAYLEPLARTDLHAEGIDYLRLYAKRPTWQRVVRRDFLQHSRAIVERWSASPMARRAMRSRSKARSARQSLPHRPPPDR